MAWNARLLQRFLHIGEKVEISLADGTVAIGELTELGREHLVLDDTRVINIASVNSAQEHVPHSTASPSPSESNSAEPQARRSNPDDDQTSSPLDTAATETTDSPAVQQASEHSPQKAATSSLDTPAPTQLPTESQPVQQAPKHPPQQTTTIGKESPSVTPSSEAYRICIQATERVRAAIAHAVPVAPSEPDTRAFLAGFGQAEAKQKREWEKILHSYEYAKKIDELAPKFNRVQHLASSACALSESVPDNTAAARMASFFSVLAERYDQAKGELLAVAAVEPTQSDWFSLAWLYLRLEEQLNALVCYVKGFSISTPLQHEDSWWAFVHLVIVRRHFAIFDSLLNSTAPSVSLVTETMMFLLSELGLENIAFQLANEYQQGHATPTLLRQLLRAHAPKHDNSAFDRALAQLEKDIQARRVAIDASRFPHLGNGRQEVGKLLQVYSDKRYGWIGDSGGRRYHFSFGDISDLQLYAMITGMDSSLYAQQVRFACNENHLGLKAEKVIRADLEEDLMPLSDYLETGNRAIAYAESGQLHLAIHEGDKCIRGVEPPRELLQLLESWREGHRKRIQPKGTNPYARAQRAKQRGDMTHAVKEFEKAILEKDNTSKAIVELALLHSQQCDFTAALRVLDSAPDGREDRDKIQNTRVTVLLRAAKQEFLRGEFEQAEHYYRGLLKSPHSRKNNSDILAIGNIAVCLARQGRISEAREFLSKNMDKRGEQRLREIYDSIDNAGNLQLLEFDEHSGSRRQSEFFTYYTRTAESEGYNAERFERADFDDSDINRLGGAIEGAGNRKPETRAALLLTSARILESMGDYERASLYGAASFRDRARHANENQRLKPDIALSWYAEAFLAYERCENILGRSPRKFLDFIYDKRNPDKTFISMMRLQGGLKWEHEGTDVVASLSETANLFAHEPQTEDARAHRVIDMLVWLSTASSLFPKYLEKILKGKKWQEYMSSYCGLKAQEANRLTDASKQVITWDDLRKIQEDKNRVLEESFYFLSAPQYSQAWLTEAHQRTEDCVEHLLFATDTDYLKRFLTVIRNALATCSQASFELRDSCCANALHEAERLLEDIRAYPTKFAIEKLRLVVNRFQAETMKFRESLAADSVPLLTVGLDSEKGKLNSSNGHVDIYISVRNEENRAMAEDVRLNFVETPESQVHGESINVTEALRGGDAKPIKYRFTLDDACFQEPAVALTVFVSYRRRALDGVLPERTEDVRLTVQLLEGGAFQSIENPYTAGANGVLVRDEEMFYGREDEVQAIVTSLIAHRDGGNCELLYGQKRSGKSSIMFHVKKRLREADDTALIVDIGSIGKLHEDRFHDLLLWEILRVMRDALEDMADCRSIERLRVGFPKSCQAFLQGEYCREQFNDILRSFQRERRKTVEWKDVWMCVFIDEFTYIYNYIRNERLPSSFMQFWKAVLQEGFFSAFIVGQDFMPKFIQRFPNEMQVMGPRRISYLDARYAEALITEPIFRTLNANPFRGSAVDEIIQLSGGSPWYIQILCDRLVQYMNRERLLTIQVADIEEILRNELLSGSDPLLEEHFDNLITSGENAPDVIPGNEVLAVIRAIALNSSTGDCARAILDVNGVDVDAILEDLLKRGVISLSKERYRISVGLFKEWLIHNQ